MSFDPNDETTIFNIYREINQGWLVVKLIELIIIPYGYYVIRPNPIARVLFWVCLVNIAHNLLSYTALYFGVLYGNAVSTKELWLLQAICAAIIRILELYCNYLVVKSVSLDNQVWTLRVVTLLASVGVVLGRVADSLSWFTIQNGSFLKSGNGIVAY